MRVLSKRKEASPTAGALRCRDCGRPGPLDVGRTDKRCCERLRCGFCTARHYCLKHLPLGVNPTTRTASPLSRETRMRVFSLGLR